MNRTFQASIVAVALSAGWITPAHATAAQQPSVQQQFAEMQARMDRLDRRVDTLEGELDKERARADAAEARAKAAEADAAAARADLAKAAPPPATVSAKPATQIAWKGAPELSTKDGWSFKPRGRMLFDAGTVSAPAAIVDNGLGFASEARRIRIGVEGTVPGGFGYKFEADVADGSVEMTDALVAYKKSGMTVTLGQHNPFQSLEELTSSNDTSFIERAAFTDVFAFQRKLGLSLAWSRKDLLVQGGVFTDNISALGNDENNSYAFDGRVVYAPKLGKAQLHFGGSAHWRDLGDSITSKRYRQRPLLHTTDTRFIDTGTVSSVSSETSYGVEAAVVSGRFHAAGEAHWMQVGRDLGAEPTFFGASLEAGLFLTEDTRPYRSGIFRGVKVARPVGKGGLGAWQVNLRYDFLDMNDAGIVGGQQDSVQASLIWTPVDQVRLMLNYGWLKYTQAAIPAAGDRDYTVNVVGGRVQVAF